MKKNKLKDIQTKLYESKEKYKIYCKCGHPTYLVKSNYKICTWCGNMVFKDKKTEFLYKVGKKRVLFDDTL